MPKPAINRIGLLTRGRPLFFILLCLYSLLAYVTVFAQNSPADSLKKIIDNQTTATPQRLTAYTHLTALLSTKDFDEAVRIGTKGLILARNTRDDTAQGDLNNSIGIAHYFKGNYDIASQYFFRAVQILEQAANKKKLAESFNNLAKLYRKTKQLDKSETYYDRAMSLYIELRDSAGIQMIWNESGVVFEYRGDYHEAVRRYSKALAIARSIHDDFAVGYALSNLSGVYVLQEKFTEAEAYMLQALDIRLKIKDTFAIVLNYSDMGSLYLAKGDYAKALQSIEHSNTLATQMKYPELLSHNYKLLSELYTKQNKHKEALVYFQKATTISDSIFNIAKAKQVEELNTKYETGKKEQQIALQEVAISRRNYIIGGVILVLLLSSLLAASQYRKYKLKQEARLQEEILHQQQLASRAVLEAEEKERQRIGQDLHDGVGQMMSAAKINLSTFLSDIQVPNEEEQIRVDNILSLIDESCKEVRAVSHNMMPNALLKAGLSSAVREFVNKIDTRIMEVNLYSEGLDERLNTTVETVLYRVIQECVNNVIKHAAATRLDISIIKDEEGLSATIEDNGKGFDINDMSIRNGIGLKNIETRIQYLRGIVEYESRIGHGTVVIINIPSSALNDAV